MRGLWAAAHLLGMVAWLGGAWSALLVARAAARESAAGVGPLTRIEAALYRVLVGPGAMLTVVSGLTLTLRLYGGATSTGGLPRPLMVMQLTGLLGAGIALVAVLPTANRLVRLDPDGEYAAAFRRLRAALTRWNAVSVLLALAALLAGALR